MGVTTSFMNNECLQRSVKGKNKLGKTKPKP